METLPRRIIAYNFLVMLGTAILFLALISGEDLPSIVLIFPALVFALLAVWNITFALLSESLPERRAYSMGLLLIVLIGIGPCAIP